MSKGIRFEQMIESLKRDIEEEMSDRLPRKVGVLAVQHFKQNFRDSGFRDGGLSPWQKSQRELSGGRTASARYKTLTSARNHLMNSIQSSSKKGEVLIENPVPYATLHNEGGQLITHPKITPQMRKFAWAMVYKLTGKRRSKKGAKRKRRKKGVKAAPPLPPEAQKWKALALTKKQKLTIKATMPKRQFIGDSCELVDIVNKEVEKSIERIKKNVSKSYGTITH